MGEKDWNKVSFDGVPQGLKISQILPTYQRAQYGEHPWVGNMLKT